MYTRYITLREYLEINEDFEFAEYLKKLDDSKLIDVFLRTAEEDKKLTGSARKETSIELLAYIREISSRNLLDKLK